jgi:hypothetical protein
MEIGLRQIGAVVRLDIGVDPGDGRFGELADRGIVDFESAFDSSTSRSASFSQAIFGSPVFSTAKTTTPARASGTRRGMLL